MKRNLKKFVTENRTAFDSAHPPKELWQRIEKELEEREKSADQITVRKMLIRVFKVAAITFLIGTAGILVYFYGKKNAYEDYRHINPELAAEQQTYSQLVLQKKDSVAIIATKNPSLHNEFSKALSQIEANYETLKQEFANSPNKELTLAAMIRNLQAQIEVLSQQMEILNYLDKNENQTKNEQI
ncbi:hypothetical protein GCM10011386_27780 [Parapedobacter defluvii]|uniref:Uncharacterized protein n=1 Tax=Parapedobacter defluvii TaxID=2045106 RepID=A0ABQ1M6F3_9SPHI|nr:hypothetical protein [Parapedobacter defluvii]GGC34155.1 hypothetical protein GCM10011386_27780 [Parapedobacter defluvii]